jgi:hypothetical protein
MPYEVRVQKPHVIGDPRERDMLKAQVAGHGSTFAPGHGAIGLHLQ